MKIHVIKALWGSTSKILIIRARNAQAALDKAFKMKECEGAYDFLYLEERSDAWKDRAL